MTADAKKSVKGGGLEQKLGPAAPKQEILLEDILNATNFAVYHNAAAIALNYNRTGGHESFNLNAAGKNLYQVLSELVQEIPNKDERMDIALMMDALQRHITNGSLTKQGFEDALNHAKAFLGPYAKKIKGALKEEHHRAMGVGLFLNSGMYGIALGDLVSKAPGLDYHTSGARAAELGTMLKELNDKVKSNDASNVDTYYDKLTSKGAVDNYVKAGKGSEEDAKAIIESGKKAYQSLVGSLKDDMKHEHQKYITNLLAQTYQREIQKVDYNHLKGLMDKLDPATFMALIPQAKSQGYEE